MPTLYKISGTLAEDARVFVIDEDSGVLESDTNESSGSFEIDPVDPGSKLVIARKSDGQSVSYGNVNPISYGAYFGYVYGGYDGSSYLQDTDEYNPDTWSSKTNMPTPARGYLAASTISDKGYVYGGYRNFQDTDEYNPDTWTSKSDMPAPGRHDLAASTI